MKKLVIVGNGGFAREVEWIIARINKVSEQWDFLGYIANEDGDNVLGDDSCLMSMQEDIHVVIAIGSPILREKLYNLYRTNKNFSFPNIIDPSVIYSDTVHMGKGNIICARSILTVDIAIGDFNIINLGCTVGHDVRMGSFITINPGVNISGNVCIEDACNIGTNSSIIQGKTLAINTIVGAGAVVTNNLPGRCTAVGVPAKVIRQE